MLYCSMTASLMQAVVSYLGASRIAIGRPSPGLCDVWISGLPMCEQYALTEVADHAM